MARLVVQRRKLTLDDVEDFEEATARRDRNTGEWLEGDDLLELFDSQKTDHPVRIRARHLKALAWIVLRREKPGTTLAEVGDMDIRELDFDFSENPTKATPLRSGRKPTKTTAKAKSKDKAKAKKASAQRKRVA